MLTLHYMIGIMGTKLSGSGLFSNYHFANIKEREYSEVLQRCLLLCQGNIFQSNLLHKPSSITFFSGVSNSWETTEFYMAIVKRDIKVGCYLSSGNIPKSAGIGLAECSNSMNTA